MLGHRVRQRQRHRGAVALDDVAHALVNGGFERVQALGRAELVVNRGNLKLDAGRVAGATEFFSEKLVALDLTDTDRPKQACQRVDPNHLDGLAFLRKGHTSAAQRNCCRQEFILNKHEKPP